MQLKRKLAISSASALLVTGAAMTGASPASASVSGTVSGDVNCVYQSYGNVSGIWVDATNGTDGWATTSNDGTGGKYFSYHLTASSSSYSLHIGCGGTKDSWAHTYYANGITTQYVTVTCADFDGCVY